MMKYFKGKLPNNYIYLGEVEGENEEEIKFNVECAVAYAAISIDESSSNAHEIMLDKISECLSKHRIKHKLEMHKFYIGRSTNGTIN